MECPACHTPNADGARFCAKCGALLPAAPSEEADPLIGSVIGGRFRIIGVLGEGGMGRVYNGEQQMGTSVRKVAVKTLLAQYAKDPQVVARFMRECGTVSELEHPNTIKVYDFGQTPSGELYIAMELLSGQSLEKALESGALSPERVDKILGQTCGSLQEAHDKGIVHRDLKPANIYLTTRAGEEDVVKVLDFGIAKRDDKHSKHEAKLTQAGTVLGTPPYMSPEQFRGQELDPRSDIYSLGVMAYEMLTGRLPFDADTPWAWATQHMTAQPFPFETVPLGSSVPPKMKAAVMRALSKDKNQRQQSVKEFYEEFTIGMGRTSGLGGPMRTSLADMGAMSGGAAGSAQTQLGAPAYGSGPQQQYQSGSQPVVGDRTSMPGVQTGGQGVYPSSPGMAVPADAYPGAPAQVPAPPPANKKGGAGPIIGVVAVVGVIGIVGAVFLFKGKGGSTNNSADAGATTAGTSSAGKTNVQEDDAGAPAADSATADAGAPPKPTVTTPTTVTAPPKPTVTPAQEQACRAAESAAAHDNLPDARRHYASCEGNGKVTARAAIEQAEIRAKNKVRVPPPPPCKGRHCPR
jgi:serine/threonine-protein kinase